MLILLFHVIIYVRAAHKIAISADRAAKEQHRESQQTHAHTLKIEHKDGQWNVLHPIAVAAMNLKNLSSVL